MKCLLIGGHWDGDRVEVVDGMQSLDMPAKLTVAEWEAAERDTRLQRYQRETLQCGDNVHYVFAHDVPPGELIARLIEGYRRE